MNVSSCFIWMYEYIFISLQAKTKQYNNKNTKIMKEKIKEFGKFNGWRGCMGLYFNTKQLRPLKKYGITAATTLEEAYNIINK